MRKTKIVCTIGPACRDLATLRKMVEAGMNVARLNFSHGDHEYHAHTIALLKQVRDEMGVPLAIMLDTKGPEVRLRAFEGGSAMLLDGQTFTLTTLEIMGSAEIAQQTFAKLPEAVAAGNTILIDDGKIVLKVESTTETDVVCRVVHGGKVSNHKGVNVPNVHLDMPVLGEKDRQDLLFGIEQDVDLVAVSFVRCKQDVVEIRKFLNYNGDEYKPYIPNFEFSDITGHKYEKEIKFIAQLTNCIEGDKFEPDKAATYEFLTQILDNFWYFNSRPQVESSDKNITRQDLARICIEALGYKALAELDIYNLNFKDASKISAKNKGAVALACGLGLFNVKSGSKFNPKSKVTRGELAAVLAKALAANGGR